MPKTKTQVKPVAAVAAPRKPTTQVFTCRFLPETVTALKAAGGAKLVRKLVERELARLAKAAAK